MLLRAGCPPDFHSTDKKSTWMGTCFASFPSFLMMYKSIFASFGWSSVYILCDYDSTPIFSSIAEILKKNLLADPNMKPYFKTHQSKNISSYDAVLAEFRSMSRGIVQNAVCNFQKKGFRSHETTSSGSRKEVFQTPFHS